LVFLLSLAPISYRVLVLQVFLNSVKISVNWFLASINWFSLNRIINLMFCITLVFCNFLTQTFINLLNSQTYYFDLFKISFLIQPIICFSISINCVYCYNNFLSFCNRLSERFNQLLSAFDIIWLFQLTIYWA